MQFTGLPELRSALEAAGWRIENYGAMQENACNWYAWSADRAGIAPDCECNDKPPGLVIHPYDCRFGEVRSRSVTVDLTGERDGVWWKLTSYAVAPEEFMQRLPRIRAGLAAAWAAVAAEVA